ncbi:NnrS family protein [Aliirhizobium smilacinae]|nr:NnrS family protein [Rhizobium smilacinae]
MSNTSTPAAKIRLSNLALEGFRPFFLFGALYAALTILLWVPWYLGFLHVPTALTPIAWHQHELLFGYVPAIIAGFLLTAMPNWTKRKRLTGMPLVLLVALWLAGRVAIFVSEKIGLPSASAINIAFLIVLGLYALREVVASNNTRNYKLVGVISLLAAAQALFLYEFFCLERVEIAGRLAIAAIILMIAIVGGRIIPNFTGNWLKKNNPGREPPPFARFDLIAMAVSSLALASWPAVLPFDDLTSFAGALMVLAGILQLIRQARWCPERTFYEPLVAILHLAFLFVPLGFILTGIALIRDDGSFASAGVHAWTSGAIGTMTLAVMTRATRGHSGQALHAPVSTVLLIYLPIIIAALLRIAAALAPQQTMLLLPLAATCWIVAFGAYTVCYGRFILSR